MGAPLALMARKPAILEDAKKRIPQGETLAQIAASHNVDTKTLNTWLLALGDEYQIIRQAYIDDLLLDAKQKIDESDDSFPLARAREQLKYAMWLAERRDKRYSPKQEVDHGVAIQVTINRGARSPGRTLEHVQPSAGISVSDQIADAVGEIAAGIVDNGALPNN